MTILTKALSEKKDKLVIPLVEDDTSLNGAPEDVEAQTVSRRIIIFPAHARRVSSGTVLCLLILALAGVSLGIIGGKILYNEYISVTRRMGNPEEYQRTQGSLQIPLSPMDDDNMDEETRKMLNDVKRKYFREDLDIDADNEYEKIDVPDFRNGRDGRFIHDFNSNYTGILDMTGRRCFVMPLNRDAVMPPSSLFDLVHKMWAGYYKVNTKVVRETMRVVTPPITDTTEIGQYIATECDRLPIYKLEKYVNGVVKRSANPNSEARFGQFAGKGILELNIVNMDAVLDYEKNLDGGVRGVK